jgi:hypothetical protein
MRALSSLIHVNAPNLVLFVGEALVGNDAVDQLVKFNRWVSVIWMCEFCSSRSLAGLPTVSFTAPRNAPPRTPPTNPPTPNHPKMHQGAPRPRPARRDARPHDRRHRPHQV